MKRLIVCLMFGILVFSCIPNVTADVDFDDFSVRVVDDNLDAGDQIQLKLTFDNPSRTGAASFDLKVTVDDVPVFEDENYEASFTKGADKTITLSSDDFPGPDLDNKYWSGNLMNRLCGSHTVDVSATDGDLSSDLTGSDEFTIGDDNRELTFTIQPDSPGLANKTTVQVVNENGNDLEGATVKVTWIDDPDGDDDGAWDSRDKYWQTKTDSSGEANFKVSDKFDKEAYGTFQVSVYKSDYCLAGQSFKINQNTLSIGAQPTAPQSGEATDICVSDSGGLSVNNARLFVSGPSYSKTYYTAYDGCLNVTFNNVGTYTVSASKAGYATAIDYLLSVGEKTTTTTSTLTTTTSTSTTTLMESPNGGAIIIIPPSRVYAGEDFEVTVTDRSGAPLSGVNLAIASNPAGMTDSTGSYRTKIDVPGNYGVRAEKQGYMPASTTLVVVGKPATDSGASKTTTNNQGADTQDMASPKMLIYGVIIGLSTAAVLGVILILANRMRGSEKPDKRLFEERGDSKLGKARLPRTKR
jgi:hypothetical protein